MNTEPAVRICQPGFDVQTCPDWAFLFNSDWPSLAIAYEKTINNPTSGPTTLTHNLGYPPLPIVWNYDGTYSYGRTSSDMAVTSTKLMLGPAGSSTTLTVRAFNIDISKEQQYKLPQSAQAKLPYNDQFGIKQAKSGRTITSTNLNDFIIHSRAQSPAIWTVATEKGKYFTNSNPGSQYTGPWIVYPLKTSYIPWIYAANSSDGVTYSFQTINGIEYINNQIVLPLIGSNYGSLVVLRDPLFYSNKISVTY